MTQRGENDWQSEKTLSECMRYMLDNEIATDVIFEVGPPDGATVNIRAHKYMLISRSVVFEAMFSSGMTECSSGPETTIRVEDIDAAIFRDLLIYIYCEVLTVNDETAASLMYAAKKYMVSKLVRECQNYLSGSLNVNNVIEFLEQSLLFHDDELKSKCLKLFAWNAEAVLRGTEIMTASTQSMETILEMDNIPVREIVLYETCFAWAKHQLQIQESIKDPTDQQIREKLGDLLYKIRFPTMELTEFAEISDDKNVLTGEEKASVYYFLATKKKGSQLMFSTERRGPKYFVDRTVTCENERWSWSGVDAITFTTNRDILLTGIGLYTGYNGNGYAVDIEILQFFESLFKKRFKVPSTGDENQFQVLIDVPIHINAGLRYSVKATPDASIGHYGDPCQDVCTKENVTFTFSGHMDSGKTSQNRGQIPRLYFCY